ncbi:leucine rich repeat domain-containing protein [Drechmeria coniospora]|uniref:Leucine rich repeat domain-containing protein n=1 Tax=Drechmeria coniospora TaxID=98403 RepID=A0A151GSR7_DRECN|nr:leucine rich repeat domain-containing protein [Drechmeria coniospora]KYK60118.1 leucine rich repeat domain-containing protein [Drechmeria coniospora]ODA80059.1 hypothetical protein RJ55_03017 [Drechmeria coniospora]
MDSEDGEYFVKQLAAFVRTHEKALANALQFQRREARHRSSQSTSAAAIPTSPTLPDRPSTSSSTNSLAAAFSFGSLKFTSHSVKSAKLALTPHHLFYMLSRFEELGIDVGPMKVRLENLHDSASSTNYISFLGNTGRSRSRSSDVGSIHSVSSISSVMSGMSALWASFSIGSSISAARTERQKAAAQADLKYLYSAFTKIPCLKLAPDWRARLIRGYEEFPFDSAVPIYVFKNLQALEISSIDFRQFFGWDRLADQLRSLSLRHAGIEDPADILIDVVLDDMDRRRRRSSKAQSSPTSTWAATNIPRRSSTFAQPQPELVRAVSAPGSPEVQHPLADLRIGLLAPNESAMEDADGSDNPGTLQARRDRDDAARSPPRSASKGSRPRSSSPSRPLGSRNPSSHARLSQRIRRSGSGSSHSSLSDSWHHHSRAMSANLMYAGGLPPSKWRFLRHLCLADNAMTSIPPASLAPLSNTLYSLDLSSNLFSQIPDSLASLSALRALNLSQCMIDSLHSLTRSPLPAITALNLRANRLQSLAGVEKLYPLERLDLRDNGLADPMELARLTGIPDIREIWVDGNPFTRTHKDYRITIFNLFRATPGYTMDVDIDGSGPSYSERRQLVDRALIPDSVPVVKPKIPEAPAIVEVAKPAIVYGAPRDGGMLRKERSASKSVTNEVNPSSTRRRKAPKRRIVDLANEQAAIPAAVDPQQEQPRRAESRDASDPPIGNYLTSRTSETILLPPVVLSDGRLDMPTTLDAVADKPEPREPAPASLPDAGGPQNWDVGGELYRRKIEALRDRVGSGYLSVLSEESWDGSSVYAPAGVPPIPPLRAGHMSHHATPGHAVHSGRMLG